jgi:hypothetical protein
MTRKLKPGDLDYLTDPCDDLACATAMIGLDMFTGDKMQRSWTALMISIAPTFANASAGRIGKDLGKDFEI